MSAEKEQKLQIQTIFWQTKALYPIGSNCGAETNNPQPFL